MSGDIAALVGRLVSQSYDRYAPKHMLRQAATTITDLSNNVATLQTRLAAIEALQREGLSRDDAERMMG